MGPNKHAFVKSFFIPSNSINIFLIYFNLDIFLTKYKKNSFMGMDRFVLTFCVLTF